jgi:hypothetical protein
MSGTDLKSLAAPHPVPVPEHLQRHRLAALH